METELKFQIPVQSRAAVARAVTTRQAKETHLQAVYVDSADRRLAAAGLALRLRRQGAQWVQAVKGRGDGITQRLEHEVVLGSSRTAPAIDPGRHAGTAAGTALEAALAGAELQPLFGTDIRRTHRRVASGGASIEIALDLGHIVIGRRRYPVHEIEFELLAGPPLALAAFAARWVGRFGLWWDPRTKAERGHRLAAGLEPAEPVGAGPPPPPAPDAATAFAAMLSHALAQLLPNAAEIADGRGGEEHLHQLRVAIRRARSVLRLAADWSADPADSRAIEAAWREPFAHLGRSRDEDVLAATLGPVLARVGVELDAHPVEAPEPGVVVRSVGFQTLLLRMLALAGRGIDPQQQVPPWPTAAARLLNRAWRKALGDAEGFADATPEARHLTRKRLKRLRYTFELLLPLLAPKPARRLHRSLRGALDSLGALNDLVVALEACRRLAEQHPQVVYAIGYALARRDAALQRAARDMHKLAAVPRPWRKGLRARAG